jgi:hypothetical protein
MNLFDHKDNEKTREVLAHLDFFIIFAAKFQIIRFLYARFVQTPWLARPSDVWYEVDE